MESAPTCRDAAKALGKLLTTGKLTLSTAESCTGGMIGATITSVPGSSNWFKGGIIAYNNTIKTSLLGVSKETLNEFGAVSEETVTAMAKGAAQKLNTDCSIAVSGIAGPDGGTIEKPVGLVYIGICCRKKTEVFKHVYSGDRENVRKQTVLKSLEHLNKACTLLF